MSRILVNQYLADLDRLRRVAGARNEETIREAFKDLLKGNAKARDLLLVVEVRTEAGAGRTIRPDGVVLYESRLPLGHWEAKDPDDDLDAAIERKLRKGYPQGNIISRTPPGPC